jgi:hypothetical protein
MGFPWVFPVCNRYRAPQPQPPAKVNYPTPHSFIHLSVGIFFREGWILCINPWVANKSLGKRHIYKSI